MVIINVFAPLRPLFYLKGNKIGSGCCLVAVRPHPRFEALLCPQQSGIEIDRGAIFH